jgi:ribosomal protein L11 methyltransferase
MMPTHLELEFELCGLDPVFAEDACFEAGALAVTFSSAGDMTQRPVLEPKPGEMPLWAATRVQVLFAATEAADSARAEQTEGALIARLAKLLGVAPERLAIKAIADRVWEREWLRDFRAMRFGERLWICPQHEHVHQTDAVVLTLDPGLAFGTGTHASTALCLEWLDAAARSADGASLRSCSVIDYGCGSGVLAIASLLLGASEAQAFDHDPQALLATHANAVRNDVGERLLIRERAEELAACDLLLANILAAVLIELAPHFAALVRPEGQLLLSGILAEEEDEVASAFVKWFHMRRFDTRDGWVALAGKRY